MTRLRWFLLDLAVALAMVAAMLVELYASGADDDRDVRWSLAVIVLGVLPTFWRRQRPVVSLVACMAALYVVIGTADIYQTVPFPSMLAGYSVALVSDRRRTILTGVLLVPFVLGALQLYSEHGLLTLETAKNLGLVALPLVLGVAVRDRRAYLAALVDRAETAERTREEETLRRVGEERLRIARDVHDVVAHAMVAINVQAGVAAHLMAQDQDKAHDMLLDIKKVSGEALADLRSTLGILRTTGDGAAPVSPVTGVDGLEELGSTLRAAGVALELDIDPDVARLPDSIGATGFRIVQEALTNVLRHAGSSRTCVSVRRHGDHLEIDVLDDGSGTPVDAAPGSGNGVRGMRERALAMGGTLDAGPHDDGGWRVHATIPIGAAP